MDMHGSNYKYTLLAAIAGNNTIILYSVSQ